MNHVVHLLLALILVSLACGFGDSFERPLGIHNDLDRMVVVRVFYSNTAPIRISKQLENGQLTAKQDGLKFDPGEEADIIFGIIGVYTGYIVAVNGVDGEELGERLLWKKYTQEELDNRDWLLVLSREIEPKTPSLSGS